MIRLLLISQNSLLIEGFRSLVNDDGTLTIDAAAALPDRSPGDTLQRVVLIDSQLSHDGCRRSLRLLPRATPAVVVVPDAREMVRISPLLPSSVLVLRTDLTLDSILGFLRQLAGIGYRSKPAERPSPVGKLTSREIEILRHVAEGLSNKEIAAARRVSPETVKFHLAGARKKLGAFNRTAAVIEAIRLGLVDVAAPALAGTL